MNKFFQIIKVWLKDRLGSYAEMQPRFLSTLVMIGAAGTTAIVAIGYARATEWATKMMETYSQSHSWLFISAAPFWFVIAWALVHYGAPKAGGSGIPRLLVAIESATLNEKREAGIFHNVRLIVVKILSSLAAILGGGAVGREGPTIQISSAIFELFDGVFKKYVSDRKSRESLLIAGGGAGLAAAFNTPLGGVVFAIEELTNQHFKTFKGVLILSVVTAGYVTQAVLGPYLFIGHPAIGRVTTKDTAYGLIAAVVIGIAGALFGAILYRATNIVRRFNTRSRLYLAAVVGLVVSGVCVLLGPDGSGGGSLLIRKLLFGSAGDIAHVGWTLAVWRFFGVIVTYLSGCAGGIFAPSLAAGAALGAMLATTFTFENHSLIIVLAMVAFLAGVTRSPFTSFILVFEMTDRQGAVIPMMAAALLASMVARLVEKESFYEKTKRAILDRESGKGTTEK